jgi:hypothetical protein
MQLRALPLDIVIRPLLHVRVSHCNSHAQQNRCDHSVTPAFLSFLVVLNMRIWHLLYPAHSPSSSVPCSHFKCSPLQHLRVICCFSSPPLQNFTASQLHCARQRKTLLEWLGAKGVHSLGLWQNMQVVVAYAVAFASAELRYSLR